MYEQVFNFNSRPFTSTPYVKHYFPASAMNQAFGQASICIQRGSGPVVAIGDIGTGKSLLLAKLEAEYQSQLQVVNLVCSSVNSRREFLQNILFQIGKPFNMESETELRFAVIESVQQSQATPNGMLLLIDDAEMLTPDVFDELRVLSNVVVEGTPQVRLVLAGKKSLEERLADPAHASFSQRIASRVFLNNLNRDETAAYVVEHVNRVGGDGQSVFPHETAVKLQELTDGCPRLINQVCDFGLILAGTRGLTTVSANLIEEAWNDVQALPMGNSSATSESSTLPTSTSDNEWTLIEFGQLDDDAPQPADGTVYDFENSETVDESITEYPPEQGEPQSEIPLQVDDQFQAGVTSKIDTELGVDLGSLQAMQDAAAAKQAADLQEDGDSANAESTHETTAENPASESESKDQNSADAATRIAMEQQLAAVFGTSLPSSAPAEAEASDTSTESDAQPVEEVAAEATGLGSTEGLPSLAPEEPSANQDANVPRSIVGPVAGSAFAAGAFAAAVNSFTPAAGEASAAEESVEPPTSALNEESLNVDEPVASEQPSFSPEPQTEIAAPASEPEPTQSFTPAFPVDDAGGFVPATQPIDFAVQQNIETPVDAVVETQSDQHEEQMPTPDTAAADNPFGESFELEAQVPNRSTSEIIEQNQNALKISSADLEHVQPIHAPTPDEIVHVSPNQTGETASPNSGAAIGVNWLQPPAAEPNETSSVGDMVQPTNPDEPPTASSATPHLEEPEAVDPIASRMRTTVPTRGFSVLPMVEQTAQKPEPASIETASEQPVDQTTIEPIRTEPTVPIQTSSESEDTFDLADAGHGHDNSAASEEISRQADAILERLKKVNQPQVVDQEDQILADIREQQREVTDSQLLADPDELQTSLPIPTLGAHQDDSEMLVVSPKANSTENTNEPESFPMTDSPISSGRASRMDYEQLFDRLRNLPDGDQ